MLKDRDQAGDSQDRFDLGDIRQDQPSTRILDRGEGRDKHAEADRVHPFSLRQIETPAFKENKFE